MVSAKLRENRLRIGWDISEKRVKMIIKMHRDLWKRIIHSRFVAIATVLAFLSFFVWRLLTSESDVKSLQTVKIGCFTFPSKRGVSEKQSFLVHFQLRIISYKKKKKKIYWVYVAVVLVITLSLLATCPVVQLPSRKPRNCEKCKVFRLIHVPNGFMNKFSYVAQTATLGNFFN